MKMNKTLNAVKRRFANAQGAVSDVACKFSKAPVAVVCNAAKGAAIGAVAVVGGAATAAPTTIDTTEIVATITAGVTAISAIGVAVISLVGVIKLYKWVQRVL